MKYPVEFFFGYGAYVAIHHGDGSVVVAHGGVECGQGINTKAAQVAAATLKVPLDMVSVKPLNNVIMANAFVTGGSITSEAVCFVSQQNFYSLCFELTKKRKNYKWVKFISR